jgi:3-hydroxybutyryl-CoA dehydratase
MRHPQRRLVGERPEARIVGPVTATHIVRFAGAGGDFNPLHHDDAAARAAGFGGVIAMGQLQAGILAGFLSDWVGIEHLRAFEVRFVAPVSVGDVLILSAEVASVDVAAKTASVVLRASVGDRDVVSGSATVATSLD